MCTEVVASEISKSLEADIEDSIHLLDTISLNYTDRLKQTMRIIDPHSVHTQVGQSLTESLKCPLIQPVFLVCFVLSYRWTLTFGL